ncbi:MAG: ATP-binding protein [Clostridia bacterium]|nr:ATP-binding protein [Clostridia bacterium]
MSFLFGKNNRWAMLDKIFFSMFITFSLIEIANVFGGIIDGLIVSNFLDHKFLAAVGIANPMFSLNGIISGMFSIGMQTKCAQELGRGQVKETNRLFSATFYIGGATAFVLMLVEIIFSQQMAGMFGAAEKGAELAQPAAEYICGLALGFPATVLCSITSSGCQLDSGRKRVMRSVIVSVVADIVFDYMAIGFNTGVFGIGLATALSRYAQLGYLLMHFKTKDKMLCFTRLSTSFREMRELLSYGTEKALRRVTNVIAPVVVNNIIIFYGGADAMAAMTIQKDMLNFVEILAVGLADATSLQMGVLFGEKNDEAIREIGHCVHKFNAIFLGGVMVLLIIFSKFVASLYISEEGAVRDMVVFVTCMAAVFGPLTTLVRTRITYLQAIAKTKNMQALVILNSLVYLVLSSLVLGGIFGAYGVLAARPVCMLLTLITVWFYYAFNCKKLIPSPMDYLALPKGFRCRPGDIISLDVRSADDVSVISEQIQLFCKGHGLDSRTSLSAALCFEELAVNTMTHGFPKCKDEPGIDLRLVYSNDGLILRLRDNCPVFNVERYIAQEISSSKGELRLGLKLVGALANDISYVHSLETNNVIIRFPPVHETLSGVKI